LHRILQSVPNTEQVNAGRDLHAAVEAALRNADGRTSPSSDARFVPVALAVITRNDLNLATPKSRA
jgi:hypothetical protein